VRLFVFGLGYTAITLVRGYREAFTWVGGTVRTAGKRDLLAQQGLHARLFAGGDADPRISGDLAEADAVLVSIPPGPLGDPVLDRFRKDLAAGEKLRWLGYLSTIGVYGDRNGAWVDETMPAMPGSERSFRRLAAEEAWLEFGTETGKAVQIFRLAGIYGPGRNALASLRSGTARRIVKPGQVFNRIHVDDVAAILQASQRRPRAGGIYNVADDEPAPPQDVVLCAAELASLPLPPELTLAEASLSPMAASFYEENKRVSNRLVKNELGVRLRYPTYREGLGALWALGEGT
jgi:nucleoside-diphosphate-sugar epimerase